MQWGVQFGGVVRDGGGPHRWRQRAARPAAGRRRRVWAPRGQRPVAPVRARYERLCVDAFVRPTTGATYWLLPPAVSAAAFSAALREFARATAAGAGKRVVLAPYGAGWNRGKAVACPTAARHPVPPYSPELQPAERL